jgi:hypothetical protein
MQIRLRRAKPEDISRARKLLEPDRPLFPPDTWASLPNLLEDLLDRERILLCLLEDMDAGRIVFIGGSGFVTPDFLNRAIENAAGLVAPAFNAELRGRTTFLNHKHVAEANRRGDLCLLNFFGVPPRPDLEDHSALETLGNMTDAWNFFHKGFSLREIWYEALPVMREFMLRIGMRPCQERPVADGQIGTLFRFTREQALETTPSWPASAMICPRPRFGFTRGEQQLLEYALLDHSDREVSCQLQLSAEAVKKRWRFIYRKISRVDPTLLRPDLNGADQRRALLQFMRSSLQELRPY